MEQFKTNARFAGALFLIAIVAAIFGGALLEETLKDPDLLTNIAGHKSILGWSVAIEFLNGIAVIGIAALLYPVLRRHNEALATGYVWFRIIEAVFYLAGATIPLVLLALGTGSAVSDAQTVAPILAARSLIMELLVPIFLSLGALLLYSSFYQTRIVPRFLSVWGFAAAIAMAVGNIWNWPLTVQIVLVMPMLLNEVVLGIWLIARGFQTPA